MPLERSSEHISAAGTAVEGNLLLCQICSSVIQNPLLLTETSCRHSFHKICITNYIKTQSDCPVCGSNIVKDSKKSGLATSQKTTSSVATRSSAKAKSYDANRAEGSSNQDITTNLDASAGMSLPQPSLTLDSIKDLVTAMMNRQQTEIVQSLSNQVTSWVEKSVEVSLARLNINQAPQIANASSPVVNRNRPSMLNVGEVEQRTLEQLLGLPYSNNEQVNNDSGRSNHDGNSASRSRFSAPNLSHDLAFRPDKVSQIIANWKIKFNGSSNSLPVDNFIYRVEALTRQTLNGDFDILCRSASALFEGKASDWFWRFHRTVRVVQWFDLCRALRQHYRDSRTDIDIRELIRDRKQKPNEPFDTFYDSVIDLVDRLDKPLDDKTLVEILRRNLQPDIQHEILNMSISSVGQLREICRRREFFLQDMSRKHGFSGSRHNHFSKRAAEVEFNEVNEPELLEFEEVSEVSSVCWNCRHTGHRYQECLADRSVFCYGCGTPQVYKPNCRKCNDNPKNFQSSALRSAPRPKTCQQSSQTM